ncbi:MAG: HAD hydrolase-like protein [Clostridia bacterium]|nr:HAD hydrolase-like protein [Clostridia bacterium]
MKNRFETVLFDFDGTLADTAPGITYCALEALHAYGFDETDPQRLREFIGPPLVDSFLRYTDDECTAKAMVDKYREHYRAGGMFRCELYGGVAEMLSALDAAGIRMAIASSKPGEFVDTILNHLGIREYFGFISAPAVGHVNPTKCELINAALDALGADRATTAMVGDRLFDIEGAKQADVFAVGVLYGFGSMEEFSRYGADAVCETPQQISELIL